MIIFRHLKKTAVKTYVFFITVRLLSATFKLPDFCTILHKQSFLVSALYMYM